MWVTRAGARPNSVGPQLRTPTLNRQSRRVGRTSTMWRKATVTCPSPRASHLHHRVAVELVVGAGHVRVHQLGRAERPQRRLQRVAHAGLERVLARAHGHLRVVQHVGRGVDQRLLLHERPPGGLVAQLALAAQQPGQLQRALDRRPAAALLDVRQQDRREHPRGHGLGLGGMVVRALQGLLQVGSRDRGHRRMHRPRRGLYLRRGGPRDAGRPLYTPRSPRWGTEAVKRDAL